MDQKKVAAFLIDAKPEECMKFRQEGDGVVIIGPDGKKYTFSAEQLEKGELAMKEKQTLAEAAKAPASKPPAAKRRPKQTTTKKTTTKK